MTTPTEPIAYAGPDTAPPRPGVLVAVGVVSLIVAVAGVVLNAGAILASAGLYALTVPPPTAASVPPLPPAAPLTAYHGDYLPPAGLPAAGRAAVIAAVDAATPLTADRRAMLDRVLAEAGLTAFGGTAPASPAAAFTSVGQAADGPDGAGSLASQSLTTAAGRIVVNNATGRWLPADGSRSTDVDGNFVQTPAGPAFCAIAVDEAVDEVQRQSQGQLNALQAAGLAEHMRGLGATVRPTTGWATPGLRYVGPAERGCGTAELDRIGGGELWVLTTGRVLTKTYSPRLDPRTGRPVPAVTPRVLPSRRPLPIDAGLIVGSVAEYVLSAAAAVVLFVAGLRLLMDRADAPRLHGLYAVPKLCLAVVNLALFLQVAQQMAVGGFSPGVNWFQAVLGLFIQSAYPVALLIVFDSAVVRAYYRERRWDGRLVPGVWMAAAARLSPDRWTRPVAAAAVALGAVVLSADGYRLAIAGGELARSYTFAPTVLTGVVLVAAGVAALVRRPAVLAAVGLLVVATLARADGPPAGTTTEALAAARTRPTFERGDVFLKAADQPDAYVPLMEIVATDADSYNRELAVMAVERWLQAHPRPTSPEAVRSTDAAVTAMLARLHAGRSGGDDRDASLVTKVADSSQLVPAVTPWLAERPERTRDTALDLIANSKPDTVQKWDALVAAVRDPRTTAYAQQVIGRCQLPDREDRLASLAADDPSPLVRRLATRMMSGGGNPRRRRTDALTPAAAAVARRSLDDPDAEVRGTAAGRLADQGPAGLAEVVALLRSPDPVRRQTAAGALSGDGHPDRVVPAVLPLLHDADPAVRAAAVRALNRSAAGDPGPVPMADLLRMLDDPDDEVRFQTAAALRYTSPQVLGAHTDAAVRAARRQDPYGQRGNPPRLRPGHRAAAAVPVPPTYADADPVTGLAVGGPAAVPREPVLPVLAVWATAAAWPLAAVLVVGLIAGRLTPVRRSPAAA